MKKILTYFAMGLMLISCSRKMETEEMQEIHFALGIDVATGLDTKSTVTQDPNGSAGEAGANENFIQTVDIFFYQEATQNASPTRPADHHIFVSNANAVDHWTMSKSVTDADLTKMFGTLATGSKCTAYAVVNYSPTTGSSFANNATRATIRQTVKESSFNTVDENCDGYPQASFVMEGATEIQLTIQNGLKYVSGTIPVYRAASKIRLEVTVPDDIVTNGVYDGNGFKWTPYPSQMKAVLVHGVRKGIICAMDETYQYSFGGTDNFFAQANEANLWSVYGHRLPAQGDKYKEINGVSTKIGTKYEHVTPMYSYPTQDWKNTPANETYLTLLLPWTREDKPNEFKNTYYQIPIAVNPSDPDYRLKHNRYYRMEVEVGILGSFELEDKVELFPSTYIVLDWNVQKETDSHTTAPVSMSQTAYLAVAMHEVTLDNVNTSEVEYASSHDADAYITKIEYLDYSQKKIRLARIVSGAPNTISYYENYTDDGNGSYTVSGTPTNVTSNGIFATYSAETTQDAETNTTYVTFSHEIDPSTMLSTVKVFVTVTNHVVDDEYIVFTQNPPIRIEAHLSNGYAFVNAIDNETATNNIYTSANDLIGSINARSSAAGLELTGSNTNPNVYAIYISSFSQGSDYIIGDPRVTTPDNKMGHTDASWSGTTTYSYSTTQTAGAVYGTYYFNYSTWNANQGWITRNAETVQRNVSGGPGYNYWGNYTSEASAYAGTNNYYYWREQTGYNYTYRRARYYFTGYRSEEYVGLTNYYPTNPTGTENMIAPAILIASSYGKTSYKSNSNYNGNLTLELAAMRCALYQEDGYPAGRWRLPTYSEVKFIMELSTAGKIPTLFQMTTPSDSEGYWCANGRIYLDNNVVKLQSPATSTPTAPRCVYDLWYWGEAHTTYAEEWHLGDND